MTQLLFLIFFLSSCSISIKGKIENKLIDKANKEISEMNEQSQSLSYEIDLIEEKSENDDELTVANIQAQFYQKLEKIKENKESIFIKSL